MPAEPFAAVLAKLSRFNLTDEIQAETVVVACGSSFDLFRGRSDTHGNIAIRRLRIILQDDPEFLKVCTLQSTYTVYVSLLLLIPITQRLLRELKLWSRLDHPNVLRLLGVAMRPEDAGFPCFITLWMENGTVRSYLESHADTDTFPLVRQLQSPLTSS